jgi:hypothetical protein
MGVSVGNGLDKARESQVFLSIAQRLIIICYKEVKNITEGSFQEFVKQR